MPQIGLVNNCTRPYLIQPEALANSELEAEDCASAYAKEAEKANAKKIGSWTQYRYPLWIWACKAPRWVIRPCDH